jgi:hypothetical protein
VTRSVVQNISCARYVALGGAVKWHVSQRRRPPAPALWRCAEPQGGSAEFRSGPKISGTTLSKVIRFCSAACRTGVLYFGTGTEVVPGKPVVIPPAERALNPPSLLSCRNRKIGALSLGDAN